MSGILPPELCVAILRTLRSFDLDDFHEIKVNQTKGYRSAIEGLKNCSLASQAFCDIAQPLLFERVRLGNPPGRTCQDALAHADHIQELFSKRPEARNWVHILFMVVDSSYEEDVRWSGETPPYRDIVEAAMEPLVLQMPDLHIVTIANTLLTKRLYDHLYRSPKLIHFFGTRVGHSEGTVYASPDLPKTRPPLRRFFLWNPAPDPENVELMAALAQWGFASTVIQMGVDSIPIEYAFNSNQTIPEGAFSNLRTLRVACRTVGSAASLVEIFRRAVNVETMKFFFIGWYIGMMPPVFDFPLGFRHMPKLSFYDGDFSAVEAFIRGRPVSTVKVGIGAREGATIRLDQQFLARTLSGGSVPIRVLQLRFDLPDCWLPETLGAIAEVLPELEELTVKFRQPGNERNLVFGTTNYGVMPKLESLTFIKRMSTETDMDETIWDDDMDETIRDDDEEERMLLASIKRAWPNLRSARLRRDVKWKWTHDEGWVKV